MMHTIEERFIPAGAGNTLPGHAQSSANPVYPRWRGEHTHTLHLYQYFCGLSPLARGTRWTPGAGLSPFPVYPRWRGEHDVLIMIIGTNDGLSPLARGTRGQTTHE